MSSQDQFTEKKGLEDLELCPDLLEKPIDERQLLRSIDLRLLPWLSCLYLLSFMDRTSIGSAKLYGLEEELEISDQQYLLSLTIFFLFYFFLEPLSNIVVRRFNPAICFTTMMVSWGIVMTCHGFVRTGDSGGLIALRAMLGLTESGLYPGVVFYLSCWYKPTELGSRGAIFFSAATLSGSFSGLLAAAIANMDGLGSLSGWRWIFILEGMMTIVFGVLSYWMIPGYPADATFLSERERAFVIQRLIDDQQFSAAGEKYRTNYVVQCIADLKTWFYMALFMGFDGGLYALSLFLPSIISQLGFRATAANLLSVPVYFWACIATCVVGFLGDRAGNRSIINIILYLIGIVAYSILICSHLPGLSYFAVYLAVTAVYPSIANSVAWVSGNTEGSYKRAMTLGLCLASGNVQGAVVSNIYRAKDEPWYRTGHEIVLGYICLALIATISIVILLKRENKLRQRGVRDEVIECTPSPSQNPKNGVFATVEAARMELGDKWSGFRYRL